MASFIPIAVDIHVDLLRRFTLIARQCIPFFECLLLHIVGVPFNIAREHVQPVVVVLLEPDLGVTVLIVVNIDCSVDEVRWQLTYVDRIQLLVLRDNHVFNYEWHVTLGECFFVDCDANFLLAKAVLAT